MYNTFHLSTKLIGTGVKDSVKGLNSMCNTVKTLYKVIHYNRIFNIRH